MPDRASASSWRRRDSSFGASTCPASRFASARVMASASSFVMRWHEAIPVFVLFAHNQRIVSAAVKRFLAESFDEAAFFFYYEKSLADRRRIDAGFAARWGGSCPVSASGCRHFAARRHPSPMSSSAPRRSYQVLPAATMPSQASPRPQRDAIKSICPRECQRRLAALVIDLAFLLDGVRRNQRVILRMPPGPSIEAKVRLDDVIRPRPAAPCCIHPPHP